jgi:hypothetical protein
MRRPYNKDKPTDVHSTGDVKKDLTEKQLAAFGAATLAYNILEDQIDALLYVVTNVPDWLAKEVSSRIHGLDGKIAIIHKAIENSGLDTLKERDLAHDSIAAFGTYKKDRDALIHSRILNAAIGIGLSEKTRGKHDFEVLLTEDALNTYYEHVVALEKELSSLGSLLGGTNALRLSASDDPNRSRYEEAVRVHRVQFQENQHHRQSLRPLPKFPDEVQLNAALLRWHQTQAGILMGWFQPWTEVQQQRNSALLDSSNPPPWVPRPPPEEKN